MGGGGGGGRTFEGGVLAGHYGICSLYIDASSVLVFVPLSVATCHDPIPPMKGSIGGYTSTVEGSVVAFHCNEGLIPLEQMNATCTSDGSWTPNPAELICNEPPSNSEFSCQWTAMNNI